MSDTAPASTPVATAPVAIPAKAPALPRRLMPKNFAVASFQHNTWAARLDEDQKIEDVLRPDFWGNCAETIMGHDKLNPRGFLDLIHVRKPDTAEFLEVLIVAIGPGFVRVAPLRAYAADAVSEAEGSPLTTRWNPGKKCHEVIRKSDKTLMAGSFQIKGDAVKWIENHVKAMAA